jgi:cobalt transporter subunit CbtB
MTTRTVSASVAVSQRLILGIACLFLGSLLTYGVGLAKDGHLHNAAHDTRHAIGFPCH